MRSFLSRPLMRIGHQRIALAILLSAMVAAHIHAAPPTKKLPPAAKTQVDFVRDIQPLLRKNCLSCHGSEEQEGGLRLDIGKRALEGGDNGKSIIPGKSAASRLIQLVARVDKDGEQMPPDGEGTPLTNAQVGLLRAWIDQGAKWPKGADAEAAGRNHWAFQRIKKPPLPQVKNAHWARAPIDLFVLAQQQKRQIKPAGLASRTTLIRRVYLDTLGLLPSPDSVHQYLNDDRPGAYERMLERALASPHYGERWGRHWLDLARYADSDGYEKDRARPHAWRYRHWVVDALNADMPFDLFSRQQLAGDLMPDSTPRHLVASGFHRNTLHNTEGGTDPKEDFFKKTVDRTNTMGTIWLGLTVGCAQCHSHKYDPISQREYYQLFAFFNSIDEQDVSAPTAEQMRQFELAQRAFQLRRAPLVKTLDDYESSELAKAQQRWEKTAQSFPAAWQTLPIASAKSAKGAQLKKQSDNSWLASGKNLASDVYTLEATSPLPSLSALRLEVLPDKSLVKGGPGRANNGNFVLANLNLELLGADGKAQSLSFSNGRASHAQKEWPAKAAIDPKHKNGWAVGPQFGKRHVAVFALAKPVTLKAGQRLRVTLDQRYNGDTHNIGRFRLSVSSQTKPPFEDKLSGGIAAILKTEAAQRTAAQKKQLAEYYRSQDKGYLERKRSLDALDRSAPKKPDVQAQAVKEAAKARPTKIHVRGDYLRPGDPVNRRGLDILPVVAPRSKQLDRLDLANWLVAPEHPLPARVTVNRVWFRIFGRGLVATIDDFGAQGEKPSHPLLLDYLASEFVSNKWSVKHLHRLILQSATYRQSSATRADLLDIDPENIWLARQNRRRVESEIVRDLALAASGQLDPRVGGPAVRPQQPSEYSRLTYANSAKWQVSAGGDRYRRGLYTFFQRTSPYPMLITFDSPDSNTCAATRSNSNTPIQALTLWNDPVFFGAAQAMARRVVSSNVEPREQETLDDARLRELFLISLARYPSPIELDALRGLLSDQKKVAATDSKAAEQIIGKQPRPTETSAADLSAWVIVCRTMLNLDEFITRE